MPRSACSQMADALFDEIGSLVETTERSHVEVRAGLANHGWRVVAERLDQTKEVSMSTQVSIERAEPHHIDEIAPLFDAYRRFYNRTDDPRARSFLEERVARQESVVFLARLQGGAIGFCQLYPCFASVSLTRMFVLYDLFVAPQARRCGAAAALLRAAVDYAASQDAGQLMLQTAVTNLPAQSLYEREGWVRDNDFYVYEYHWGDSRPSHAR
jgi:ribosomal protein S18 acetylase RimI-like enzyme